MNPASRAEQEALGGRRTSLRAQGEGRALWGAAVSLGIAVRLGRLGWGVEGVEVTWLRGTGGLPRPTPSPEVL